MLTVVRTCSTLPEAEVVGSLLRAAGLQVSVGNQNVASYAPGAYFALGGFPVAVPGSEAAIAEDVLRNVQPAADPEPEEQPTVVDGLTAIVTFWMGWFFGVPFVRRRAWPRAEDR